MFYPVHYFDDDCQKENESDDPRDNTSVAFHTHVTKFSNQVSAEKKGYAEHWRNGYQNCGQNEADNEQGCGHKSSV